MDFSSKQRGQRPQESRSGKTLEVLTEDEVVEIAKKVKYDEVAKSNWKDWLAGEPDDTTDQNGDGSSDNDEDEDDGEHS
jgi:hypothetical protein